MLVALVGEGVSVPVEEGAESTVIHRDQVGSLLECIERFHGEDFLDTTETVGTDSKTVTVIEIVVQRQISFYNRINSERGVSSMARIYKRKGGGIWWIGYRLPGDVNERRESSRSTKRKDAERLLKTRTMVGGEPKPVRLEVYAINALCDVLEADYALQKRKSIRDTSYHLRAIRRLLGGKNGASLTRLDLVRYVETRQREGVQSGTINRELSALRRAMRLTFHDINIVIPRFPMLPEHNVRQGTYTREEVNRLVGLLPAHLIPVVWFAYHTGRRRGEILSLQWSQVDWDRNTLTISPANTKNNRPDVIVLEGPLYDLLRGLWLKRDPQVVWIFPFRGKRFRDFHKTWTQVRIRAGLPEKLFHDFRRTASTDLIEAGVPEQVAMRITGHTTRSTFDRYHIIKTGAVRDAVHQLARYRGQIGDTSNQSAGVAGEWQELPLDVECRHTNTRHDES